MLAGALTAWLTLPALLMAAAPGPAAAPAPPAPPAPPAATIRIEGGRATTVLVTDDVGAPVERAVAGRAYARAIAADIEQRWTEAESLYREAIAEWDAAGRRDPSRALELAAAKAERERQRSQLLAARVRAAANRGPRAGPARRLDALDEARLLRGKMMATRAMSGRIQPALYAQARARLEEALRTKDGGLPGSLASLNPGRTAGDGEIRLLLCATRAAAGELEAARWLRAQVTEAERNDPINFLARAACAAALGDTTAALATLEMVTLHTGPGRTDRLQLRELYIANDWDRLRGDPRFERLFPR